MATLKSVPPNSLDKALNYLTGGGRLCVRTYTRQTIIEEKHVRTWAAHGGLLSEDGDGYRMRQGKSSVYLVPGLLSYIIE